MNENLTAEQRVIEILKDRLPIDMHHYQYQELAAEILTALTEPEDEPFTVEGSSGLVDPKGYVENSGDGGLLTAEDEPKKKTVLCFQGEEYELKPPPPPGG